jgi:DtxR family Mn-dependent transcriptional regulator
MKKCREHALEAILMASEQGEPSLEGARRAHHEKLHDKDIDALERDGLISREGDRLNLTEEGMREAQDVLRRHRLTEALLFTVLGLNAQRASEVGCMLEHDIRSEMVDSVCTLLGHPLHCPHGDPIPPGPCCKERRTTVESQVVPLTALAPGERGRIVYIRPRNHQRLHRLTSLGLTPGVKVTLHRRSPAFCLRYEETELAIDRDVAEDIVVSRLSNGN